MAENISIRHVCEFYIFIEYNLDAFFVKNNFHMVYNKYNQRKISEYGN